MKKSQNQHYITRKLTEQWEINNARDILCYDVLGQAIKYKKSKTLFAHNNLWPHHFENFFNQAFEREFNNILKTLDSIPLNQTINCDVLREKLTLIFIIHILRTSRTYYGEVKGLKQLELFGKKELKKIISNFLQKYKLAIATLPAGDNQFFFMPCSAIFPFIVQAQQQPFSVSYAFPISLKKAIVLLENSFLEEQMNTIINNGNLARCSLGLGELDKVAIPPYYKSNKTDKKIIISYCKKAICLNRELIKTSLKINSITKNLEDIFAMLSIANQSSNQTH